MAITPDGKALIKMASIDQALLRSLGKLYKALPKARDMAKKVRSAATSATRAGYGIVGRPALEMATGAGTALAKHPVRGAMALGIAGTGALSLKDNVQKYMAHADPMQGTTRVSPLALRMENVSMDPRVIEEQKRRNAFF